MSRRSLLAAAAALAAASNRRSRRSAGLDRHRLEARLPPDRGRQPHQRLFARHRAPQRPDGAIFHARAHHRVHPALRKAGDHHLADVVFAEGAGALRAAREQGSKIQLIMLTSAKQADVFPEILAMKPIAIVHHGNVTDSSFQTGKPEVMRDYVKRVHDAGMLAGSPRTIRISWRASRIPAGRTTST